jgi:hypothetical protein
MSNPVPRVVTASLAMGDKKFINVNNGHSPASDRRILSSAPITVFFGQLANLVGRRTAATPVS